MGEAEVVVVVQVVEAEEISVVAAELGLRWVVLRHTIGHLLRRLGRRLRPRAPMLEVPALGLVIGQRFNRDHDQPAEQLPVHDQRRSLALVPAEERGLAQGKGSVPARGRRIVQRRALLHDLASRNSQRGCRDWVPAQRQGLRWPIGERACKTARRIDRRRRKIADPA